jgi:hypothetical protein
MVSEAEYWKVEEHEPVHPHLRVEMSPPPTRFIRRNAEATRFIRRNAEGVPGQVAREHPNAGVYVRRLAGPMERTQPDQGIGIDLRQAREKTATGNLTNTL